MCVKEIGMEFWGSFPSSTLLCCLLPQLCVCSHFFLPHMHKHTLFLLVSFSYDHVLFGLPAFCCSQVISITCLSSFSLSQGEVSWQKFLQMSGLWGKFPSCKALLQKTDGEVGWCDHLGTLVGRWRRRVEREAQDLQRRPRNAFCYQLQLC